jgi:non-ribosomal peptide synthetase component E (peptide arylation enzyme)
LLTWLIRGENVPVFDIENVLFKHPAVLSAAIVGYPDARLGERACAFLVLRPGHSLDLAGVQALMAEHKVAKRYWPERVEIVADLPKTPAGKDRNINSARSQKPLSKRHAPPVGECFSPERLTN